GEFRHNEQSLRVVDVLENNRKGLNLTHEVRDGILKHSKGRGKIIPGDPGEMACTVEGRIVRVADIMAYLNHDLDDAIRSGVIREEQAPEKCVTTLGRTHSERAASMIRDLIFSSKPENGELKLRFSDEVHEAMTELRRFLYDNVYRAPMVHNEFIKAKKILSELYFHLLNDNGSLEKEMANMKMAAPDHQSESETRERTVCDLISSMTDRYAMNLYKRLFFPSPTF
ncbi:MAG: deoxyguanosinetriphosphate triphosphohydrolase, partial [Desulfobacterales bacterium]|nr:deoxyguanosinetriphosphate triphosphohydrolase [Desulfobacterales bacterium]